MFKVEVQKEWYSVEQCDSNKNKLYVFGDNLVGAGCGGQAQIRYCQNSIGIPTKRLPEMTEDAFFSERKDEILSVFKSIELIDKIMNEGEYDTLVLPADGLGTGLAEMDKRSPKLFSAMNQTISETFEISYHI